ncbi:uncharacterized protein EV422DRAFT_565817 [Fimicolochytrium jonesii]|uniref:uncharacterized protein n=1 Tax=Fimicolochytrium jonesii TaxID=1396493 RepID=UPI0022FE8142|nr:uncharacterized protein EV422DRAFT_565817 [Fimicolochytrium jonesii]KAI8822954.1 hypothetical protein EV422DRAFT_565817 [Fimicolochytrium jonesii]
MRLRKRIDVDATTTSTGTPTTTTTSGSLTATTSSGASTATATATPSTCTTYRARIVYQRKTTIPTTSYNTTETNSTHITFITTTPCPDTPTRTCTSNVTFNLFNPNWYREYRQSSSNNGSFSNGYESLYPYAGPNIDKFWNYQLQSEHRGDQLKNRGAIVHVNGSFVNGAYVGGTTISRDYWTAVDSSFGTIKTCFKVPKPNPDSEGCIYYWAGQTRSYAREPCNEERRLWVANVLDAFNQTEHPDFYAFANSIWDAPKDLTYPEAWKRVYPQNYIGAGAPNLQIYSGIWQNRSWSGPYWPDVPSANQNTTLYAFPFPAAPVVDPSTGLRVPWSTFPYLPNVPVPYLPSIKLPRDGRAFPALMYWSFVPNPRAPAKTLAESSQPWYLLPAPPSVNKTVQQGAWWLTPGSAPVLQWRPIQACPVPPTSGNLTISGSAWNQTTLSVTYGSATANLAVDASNCGYSSSATYWSVDNGTEVAGPTQYKLPLSTLLPGPHVVAVRAVYFDESGNVVGNVRTSISITLLQPTFTAVWANRTTEVTTALPLILSAANSIDPTDPCYFARFTNGILNGAAWNKCIGNNAQASQSLTFKRTLVYFSCSNVTTTPSPCTFGVNSTATLAQLQAGTVVSNDTSTAVVVTSDATYQNFTTDIPSLTFLSNTLTGTDGTYRWSVYIQRPGFSPSALAAVPVDNAVQNYIDITIRTSGTWLSVKASIFGGQYYQIGDPVYTSGSVSTNAPTLSNQLERSWYVLGPDGRNITRDLGMGKSQVVGTFGKMIDTSFFPSDGQYQAVIRVRDIGYKNVAEDSVFFTVFRTLPSVAGCTLSSNTGTALNKDKPFYINCPSTLQYGARYWYSYNVNSSPNTTLAYPGDSQQPFVLPAGNPVILYARSYIPGTNYVSTGQSFSLTVSELVIQAGQDVGSVYADLCKGAPGQTAAAVSSFTSRLESLNLTQEAKSAATAAIITALQVTDVSGETVDTASAKAAAIASVVAAAPLTNAAKESASISVALLSAKFVDNGAPDDVLRATASAVVTTKSSDAASGKRVLDTLLNVGRAMAVALTPGKSNTVSTAALVVIARADTLGTLPRSLTQSANRGRRDVAGCQISDFDLATDLASVAGNGQKVVTSSSCVDSYPYPVNSSVTYQGSQIMSSAALTLNVYVTPAGSDTGSPFTGAITKYITADVPTTLAPARRRRRGLEARQSTTSSVPVCVMWNTAIQAWDEKGCITPATATFGSTISCQCLGLGTYTVVARQVVITGTSTSTVPPTNTGTATRIGTGSPTPTTTDNGPPGGGEGGSDKISKGAIAGAVIGSIAGAALLGAAAFYFIKKR